MGVLQELHQNTISRYAETDEFAGAIKRDKLVMAIMRDNETWALAKILEIRKKPEPTSEDEEELIEEQKQNTVMEEENNPEAKQDNITFAKNPVQYYVNYLDEARRMDRWVEENMVKINDEQTEELYEEWKRKEEIKVEQEKNATFLANDEHDKMTE